MSDCLFCKIANKEIPAEMVFESENVFAINDINPQAPHHVLIIPRNHIATVNDLTEGDSATLGEIFLAVKELAADLGISEDGYRCVFNCNAGAGQTVFHIHLHLLGGRPMKWPPG